MSLYDTQTSIQSAKVSVTTASTQILGPNPHRVGLIIGSPATNAVNVSFDKPAVSNGGIRFPANHAPVIFPIAWLGKGVTQAIHAISVGGNDTIDITEIISTK